MVNWQEHKNGMHVPLILDGLLGIFEGISKAHKEVTQ